MSAERARNTIRSIARRIIDSGFMRSVENIAYDPPETVGRIRVKEIIDDTSKFNTVKLDLVVTEEGDESQLIRKVPKNWIEENVSAEVVVRKEPREGSVLSPIDYWAVAIRPYDIKAYNEPVDVDDEFFHDMFFANRMSRETHVAFYEKFIHERNFDESDFSLFG